MDIHELTAKQLRRAAAIKDQLARLTKELGSILGEKAKTGAVPRKIRKMSVVARRKIAAAQRARWANLRQAKPMARKAKATARVIKKKVSRATRARLSAKLKAFWAAKKANKK